MPTNEIAVVNVPTFLADETGNDHSGAFSDSHLVDLWLARRPHNTQAAYRADSGLFLSFLESKGRKLQTTRVADLEAFVGDLEGTPATVGRRVAAVRSLITYGHRTGYLQFNIGVAIKTAAAPNTLAERILAEGEVHAILRAAQGRNAVLLRFLYVSGARVAEVSGLTWERIHDHDQGAIVTIHGKGGKTRHVLIPSGMAADLSQLRGNSKPSDPVFRTRTGRRIHPTAIAKILKTASRRAGVERIPSPHWFRHSHASHALDRGAPIHLVQQTLGHASLATTSRYVHARPGDGSARYLAT